jgi:hypothetical protein
VRIRLGIVGLASVRKAFRGLGDAINPQTFASS